MLCIAPLQACDQYDGGKASQHLPFALVTSLECGTIQNFLVTINLVD